MCCSIDTSPRSLVITCWARGILLRVALPIGLLLAIWLPHYAHFHIDRSPVETSTVNSAKGTPADAILDEIAKMHFAINVDLPPESLVSTAESVVNGVLRLPLFDTPLALRGYPEDLWAGSPSSQLFLVSLRIEELLLRAYDQSRDVHFLQLAIERVLAFSAYERSQHEASDFLWNDHAVAARISVLAHLWRASRETSLLGPEARQETLSLVQRSGRLLAKPSQFTVRTNHGVMQNLALLQIAAAFPTLQEAAAWRQLALERLHLQVTFYVSPEGFVLEHSGEYHAFGAELLSQAVRLCALNDLEPPAWLTHAAHLASLQLGYVIRPDGSLPLIGNTSQGSRFSIPSVPKDGLRPLEENVPTPSPPPSTTLLPVSGYAVWWNQADGYGPQTQTVINWAKHDGHGHKHADEGAVQLWSDGVDWITSTGYWPYGAAGISDAYGWRSSNAQHRIDEGSSEQRTTDLLGYIDTPAFRALDLQRRATGGSTYRRQIIQVEASTLLVLDFATDSNPASETIWTVSPELSLNSDQQSGLYLTSARDTELKMWISFDTSPGTEITRLHGSRSPFSGWVVVNNKPTPSYALRVVIPLGNSVSAALFSLRRRSLPDSAQIHLSPGATPDNWHATLTEGKSSREIARNSNSLLVQENSQTSFSFTWAGSPDIAAERAELKSAYSRAVALYPPWRNLSLFRRKLNLLIIAAALALELVWQGLLKRRLKHRHLHLAVLVLVALWAALAIWIFAFYLR